MASLMDLVERVNKGELIDPALLEVYENSSNTAEKFLAHHAHATLELRRAHNHMLQSLEAIDYSDQKVLNQFVSVSGFLGQTDLRAAPVIRFGASAIARREFSLGLEALQNGVGYDLQHGGTYTADRENGLFVSTQYARAAQGIGWRSGEALDWNNRQTRIAYVVSGIVDDEASGRFIRNVVQSHDNKRFKLHVYSTEAGVKREKQQFSLAQNANVASSLRRGTETIDALNAARVATWVSSLDNDVVWAAKELANQLIKDRIDVVIFDATQADPIASLVADWDAARVKINLCRRTPMYARGIQSVVYLDPVIFESDKEFWAKRNINARFVLEGISVNEDFGTAPQRAAYGIPDQAIVLATAAADLDKAITEPFFETIVDVLRAHPHAIYLLIGDGELAWQKRKFESAGVGKRVGYAGKRRDLPGFLRIADLYLAEFPASSALGVLQAMAVSKPVVAARWGDAVEQSQASEFVGSEATVNGADSGAYIERVSKLIREPAYRAKVGKIMRSRVESHFSFAQTVRSIEELCDQLIQLASEESATRSQAA